ncbi:Isochorismatase family protein YecD [Halomonadaceae bacterium LMG 33818]|uniref:isochorismatase family protein n=1 Tax=Cernens ardua TaxID=3402176 RepID=UPI003EDC75AC
MSLSKESTALILIDLQAGIVKSDKGPYSADEIVTKGKALAETFRKAGAPVVLIKVGFKAGEGPSRNVSNPSLPEQTPEGFDTLVPDLEHDGDIVIQKHHWGAFTGTELDLQLRRHGIKTVVIGGIATNFGVESTARSAWELSYDVVIPEDACTSRNAELHEFSINNVLKQISVVTTTDEITLD